MMLPLLHLASPAPCPPPITVVVGRTGGDRCHAPSLRTATAAPPPSSSLPVLEPRIHRNRTPPLPHIHHRQRRLSQRCQGRYPTNTNTCIATAGRPFVLSNPPPRPPSCLAFPALPHLPLTDRRRLPLRPCLIISSFDHRQTLPLTLPHLPSPPLELPPLPPRNVKHSPLYPRRKVGGLRRYAPPSTTSVSTPVRHHPPHDVVPRIGDEHRLIPIPYPHRRRAPEPGHIAGTVAEPGTDPTGGKRHHKLRARCGGGRSELRRRVRR